MGVLDSPCSWNWDLLSLFARACHPCLGLLPPNCIVAGCEVELVSSLQIWQFQSLTGRSSYFSSPSSFVITICRAFLRLEASDSIKWVNIPLYQYYRFQFFSVSFFGISNNFTGSSFVCYVWQLFVLSCIFVSVSIFPFPLWKCFLCLATLRKGARVILVNLFSTGKNVSICWFSMMWTCSLLPNWSCQGNQLRAFWNIQHMTLSSHMR